MNVETWMWTLAQSNGGAGAGGGIAALLFMVIWIGIIVLIVAGLWKTFSKAGQPGWAAIIPILNVYVICKIAGRPGWWLILLLIPIVNIVVSVIIALDVAKNFGKGAGFGIGLWFLAPIFYCILGFGSATYQGPPQTSLV